MGEMDIDANYVLDLYKEYFKYDGRDEVTSENLRWDFIEAAVDFLQRLTGRSMSNELD
jgi:hypothetical protein